MSGHSKWSTIKHKKAAQDAKKGKAFAIISKQIRIAVKEGKSGDPAQNPALRLALDKARQANMPKENVNRAIEKGLGRTAGGATIEEIVYEAYGPGGIGIRVDVVTDNRNRSGAEVKTLIERAGGSMGGPGSTAYLFGLQPDGLLQVKVGAVIDDPVVRREAEDLIEALEGVADVEAVVTNLL